MYFCGQIGCDTMAKTVTKVGSKKISKEDIFKFFIEETLEKEYFPKSVFKFCKEHHIEESEFYKHFGSFDSLKQAIWNTFHENTLDLLQKNEEYHNYGSREKLLAYFFTMFETLTMNRSYLLFSLKEHKDTMDNLKQLAGLRKRVKEFSSELIQQDNEGKQLKILKRSAALFSEAAWFQFLFLLKFWSEDGSPNFEKTDAAIEKSVNTAFDVFDNTSLERIIDFGKFLWNENPVFGNS